MGNFSKALSQLGKRDGVNVNVIHPGATETERFDELIAQRSKASGKSIEELRKEATAKDGIRRIGKAGGRLRADAVPVLGEGAAHPGHGDRGRWRRDASGITEPMPDGVRAACVIGWPVKHSRSPLIHSYWIKQHGLAADYRREAVSAGGSSRIFSPTSPRAAMSAATSRCRTRRRRLPLPSRTTARARSAPPTRCGSTADGCIPPTPTSKASPTISTPRCRTGTAGWTKRWCWAPAARRAPWSMA